MARGFRLSLALGLGLIAVLVTNDVSTALTQRDRDTAERMLRETGHGEFISMTPPATFDKEVNTILAVRSPFTYVIGLYSRHGRFYPPYNPVPDINWGQVLDNFGG